MFYAFTPVLQQIDVKFDLSQVLTWAVIGLIAGVFASLLVRGHRYGLLGSLILGLIGAVIGGFLFRFINIPVSPELENGITIRYIDIIIAFFGAIIALLFLALFYRRRP